jgi:hypothetical protein
VARFRHDRILAGLLVTVFVCVGGPIGAAQREETTPGASPPEVSRKIWTNDDVQALQSSPVTFVSEFSTSGNGMPVVAAKPHLSKYKDPSWYRVQLKSLRDELARTEAELRRIQAELKQAHGGTNALDMDKDPIGVNPEGILQVLEQRRLDPLMQISELEDLAQRNGIPPGELRRDPSPDDYAFADYMTAAANAAPPQGLPGSEAEWRGKFADLREKLYWAEKELDILRREWGSKLLQYYNDPLKIEKEQYTWREVNALRAKIAEKKAEIGLLKQAISDLEDNLRRAGGPPGWSR